MGLEKPLRSFCGRCERKCPGLISCPPLPPMGLWGCWKPPPSASDPRGFEHGSRRHFLPLPHGFPSAVHVHCLPACRQGQQRSQGRVSTFLIPAKPNPRAGGTLIFPNPTLTCLNSGAARITWSLLWPVCLPHYDLSQVKARPSSWQHQGKSRHVLPSECPSTSWYLPKPIPPVTGCNSMLGQLPNSQSLLL